MFAVIVYETDEEYDAADMVAGELVENLLIIHSIQAATGYEMGQQDTNVPATMKVPVYVRSNEELRI